MKFISKIFYMFLVWLKVFSPFHKLAIDNDAFLEFHPWHFLIKDRATRKTLLKGRCKGGLYPIVLSSSSSSMPKQVCVITKPTVEWWHSRLGHPSSLVVQQVLNKFCLPYAKSSSIETICDSCQKDKSHQLAYPISTSVMTVPLQKNLFQCLGSDTSQTYL
jgi:hypothetical protein